MNWLRCSACTSSNDSYAVSVLCSLSFRSVNAVVGCEGSKSGGRVPSSQVLSIFAPTFPMLYDGNIFKRSRRRSLSLFFGNIPETACRMIYVKWVINPVVTLCHVPRQDCGPSSSCMGFLSIHLDTSSAFDRAIVRPSDQSPSLSWSW